MNLDIKPKVSVCIVTYNHEKYIKQCLQSILNQKTDFDFEIIVGDDCSKDKTRQIIQQISDENPGRISLLFQKENVGAYKNYQAVHQLARGQYIAHLDGDDYAFEGKLKAQAEVLDNEPSCNIVFHRMKILIAEEKHLIDDLYDHKKLEKKEFFRENLLEFGSIACHSSKMHRSKISKNTIYPKEFLDFYLDVEHVGEGYAKYIDEFYGVYRANIGISTNSSKSIRRIYIEHLEDFLKKYPENKSYIGSNSLLIALSDLKNKRPAWRAAAKLWIKCGVFFSFANFLKSYETKRRFRKPKTNDAT